MLFLSHDYFYILCTKCICKYDNYYETVVDFIFFSFSLIASLFFSVQVFPLFLFFPILKTKQNFLFIKLSFTHFIFLFFPFSICVLFTFFYYFSFSTPYPLQLFFRSYFSNTMSSTF